MTQKKHSVRKRRRSRRRNQSSSVIILIAIVIIVAAVLVFAGLLYKNRSSGARHDEAGLEAYNNGDYELAVKEFKEALSYDEADARYNIHLGMAYIETGSIQEAVSYFNQAQANAGSEYEALLAVRGKGIAYYTQGKYTEAAETFENALSSDALTDELTIDILYYKADAVSAVQDYESAIECCSRIISCSGSESAAYMNRGLAYSALGNYVEAEADLRKAISMSEGSYAVYKALYDSLMSQGDSEEAEAVLSETLSLPCSSGQDYFNHGVISLKLGDMDGAEELFDKASDKGCKAAVLGEAELNLKNGDIQNAKKCYEEFLSDPGQTQDADLLATAYGRYAACLMESEDYEGAVQALRSGIDCQGTSADASLSFNLIVAYEKLHQWDKAFSAAKTYHEKYPADENGTREYLFLESRTAS